MRPRRLLLPVAALIWGCPFVTAGAADTAAAGAARSAWFGELHVHTANSIDAYGMGGVRATPDDAYRYGKGAAIAHPLGYPIRLTSGPLDFVAVTDHAEYFGVLPALADPEHPLAKDSSMDDPIAAMVAMFTDALTGGRPGAELDPEAVVRDAWHGTVEAAERHNEPGRFTTFVAYEYTSMPSFANLHRNVIFAGTEVPAVPFGAYHSPNPEDLWTWLDAQRARGMDALAIPHNSNWSRGLMFARTKYEGGPLDAAYAEQRMRNEPLMEITQVKGTSETHPLLSPNDEWAGFEIWEKSTTQLDAEGGMQLAEGATTGAYARDALRAGLEMEAEQGINPYAFGFIGASDGHNAAGSFEEDNYFGKLGDGSPQLRGSVPGQSGDGLAALPTAMALEWGASGLAGVWAEENSRESIFAALRRKETFATSGPRIRLRFFAGYGLPPDLADRGDAPALADADGVPMGSDLRRADGEPSAGEREGLAPRMKEPSFFLWALRDPNSAWLQRGQVVKLWLEEGESRERVFDVVCSDGLSPDPETHRCPDNGAGVNLADCSYSQDKGAVELATVWRDPGFDPAQRATYYARVLENPTCRWSTWDAIRAGVAPTTAEAPTIQERAWSSPIAYRP